jgi:hypothetical protein
VFDPLSAFVKSASDERGLTPLPLLSTDYEIAISSGLAVVTCHRLFKNRESIAIEAMMTFPIPVNATLFSLVADVDGRKLKAHAQPLRAARETYEGAIERGQTSVLHEELLRGIHMLSVGNILPNASIRVTTVWAASLSVFGDEATLRIPQSVGQVYGNSGLPETDDLVAGGAEQPVLVSVTSDVALKIHGSVVENNHARITNANPIDIVTAIWGPTAIVGNTADGGSVRLELSPQRDGDHPLSVAILVDHSGSMDGRSAVGSTLSCHDAAREGLQRLASQIRDADTVDLWEFNTTPRHIGLVGPADGSQQTPADAQIPRVTIGKLAQQLTPPGGGTEIGAALNATLAHSSARDILIVTDGQSYALDPGALAKHGRRISAILVGADSLEARIGHLVALTGGDIFVTAGGDLARVMDAAVHSLRRLHTPLPFGRDMPARLDCTRSNVKISAQWSSEPAPNCGGLVSAAAVAFASAMVVACAPEQLATKLAVSEGLVTHLTSLVLVDEDGDIASSLPATRKIALASPRANVPPASPSSMISPRPVQSRSRPVEFRVSSYVAPQFDDDAWGEPVFDIDESHPPKDNRLREIAERIDWGQAPGDLVAGRTDCLPEDIRAIVAELATLDGVKELASKLQMSPDTIVLALLASTVTTTNRLAARFAKLVFSKAPPNDVERLKEAALADIAGGYLAAHRPP